MPTPQEEKQWHVLKRIERDTYLFEILSFLLSLFTFLGLLQLEDSFIVKLKGMVGCFFWHTSDHIHNLNGRIPAPVEFSQHILFLEHLSTPVIFLPVNRLACCSCCFLPSQSENTGPLYGYDLSKGWKRDEQRV